MNQSKVLDISIRQSEYLKKALRCDGIAHTTWCGGIDLDTVVRTIETRINVERKYITVVTPIESSTLSTPVKMYIPFHANVSMSDKERYLDITTTKQFARIGCREDGDIVLVICQTGMTPQWWYKHFLEKSMAINCGSIVLVNPSDPHRKLRASWASWEMECLQGICP